MDTNLVIEGAKFMLLGMGTVFLFLILLIVLMNAMSVIIHKFFPEPQTDLSASTVNSQKNHKTIVAAITAAITHHRQA
ncbi:OadG family protein [bacterium]|nr:OadG family protein [bacterium]MBU1989171.1 OadG family protein [bacterium]